MKPANEIEATIELLQGCILETEKKIEACKFLLAPLEYKLGELKHALKEAKHGYFPPRPYLAPKALFKRDQVICSPTKLSFESISKIGERYV